MADKKKIPINADSEVKRSDAVSLTDKLNLAAERMTRVSSEAQEKKAEQARLLKEAEADAARRRKEANAARLEAEKQAKLLLTHAAVRVLRNGLGLLGIEAPERM